MTNVLRNIKYLPVLFICVLLFGCGEKIPIKEMTLAKMEISRALSVMAKKYAPDEIDKARELLIESHEFIKQDELVKAKDSAVKSHEKAIEAYNKSIPLLAKDTLDIASESLEKAVEVYAEVLAGDEFEQAEDSLNTANKLYEQNEYYPCYEKSLEADQLAKDARNVAIGKKDILSNAIAEVKATLQEAKTYDADIYAPDKIELAEENIAVAEESLETLQLKKGFNAIEVAGLNADEAYLSALKGTAEDRAEEAENLFLEAQDSEGAELAKDELNGAKEALDQSKSLLDESKYKESILSSDESMRLSAIVLGAMNELAKEKIAGAEIVYYQASISEGASVAADKLKAAKDALDLSKSLLDESRGKESIEQAAESERLSYIVINTKAKEIKVTKEITATQKEAAEDYYIYKVRYIPERRDCLWRIAEKFYNNGFLWKKIYSVNTDKIYDPDLIWPDMLLKVPKLDKPSKRDKEKEMEPGRTEEAITPERNKAPEESKEDMKKSMPEEEDKAEDAGADTGE